MKDEEWYKITVVCKRTDHKHAPDTVVAIQNLLLETPHVGAFDVNFDCWGDEPMKGKSLHRRAIKERPV